MAIRFILGRTGTGKTRLCIDEIAAELAAAPDGLPLILLVPEQATFQMEQGLVARAAGRGMVRAQVVSFRRLARLVLEEAGGAARPVLGELGKLMVLATLVDARAKENALRAFGRVARRPGFIEKLARSLTELRAYRKGADDLRAQVEAMSKRGAAGAAATDKLADLALILGDLEDYTRGRFLDPDEVLGLVTDRIADSRLFPGARVWVDGFAGFTPEEIAVLERIAVVADRVSFTLCLDGAEALERASRPLAIDPAYLFAQSLATYLALLDLARRTGSRVEPPVVLDAPGAPPPRFRASPEIAYLERAFFAPGRPAPLTGPAPRISMAPAAGLREEVEAAAREIRRLAREDGIRYREAAVIVPSIDTYGDLVTAIFREHGVPAFIDRRRPVPHHPLVELLRSAMEAIALDWPYEAVFRTLKTDLVTAVERGEIDLLENYVIEHGIRGRTAYESAERWPYFRSRGLEDEPAEENGPEKERTLDRIHGIRGKATKALLAFQGRMDRAAGRDGVGRAAPALEIARALFGLVEDLDVAGTLENWIAVARSAGTPEALASATEHEQVWGRVLGFFDELVEAFADAPPIAPREFLRVLESGLQGIRLGLIPPALDQVVVGTIERSRHFGIRAALILGATDRAFPRAPPEDSIFDDTDREALAETGMTLAPTSREQLFHDRYFTYLALTRAAERLWVSYPTSDDQARPVPPSPIVGRLLDCLPDVRERSRRAADPLASVATPPQLASLVARKLRLARSGARLEPVWLELYQGIAAGGAAARDEAALTFAALDYEGSYRRGMESLGGELARELFGQDFRSSVSRLESFAACPFQHFARHGLKLSERERYRIEAVDLGSFYHAALAGFVRRLKAQGLDWGKISPEDAAALMDGIVDELAPRLRNEILLSDAQNVFLLRSVRRTLQRSLWALCEHSRRGQFRPRAVEIEFGGAGGRGPTGGGEARDRLGPLEIDLANGGKAYLRGRIDRIDAAEAGAKRYLRVIDYKSGRSTTFSLPMIYHGLALQLPVYLLVAVRNGDALAGGASVPAGMFYFVVQDPIIPAKKDEPHPDPGSVSEKLLSEFKARGLLLKTAEALDLTDREASGMSPLVQAGLTKAGAFHANSSVATEEQFRALFLYVEKVLAGLVSRIQAGEVGVAPYEIGNKKACDYCEMRSACQFDPSVAGEGYNRLESLSKQKEEVWRRISAEVGGPAGEVRP